MPRLPGGQDLEDLVRHILVAGKRGMRVKSRIVHRHKLIHRDGDLILHDHLIVSDVSIVDLARFLDSPCLTDGLVEEVIHDTGDVGDGSTWTG